jgi:putative peptidoglycan lipid II flippase
VQSCFFALKDTLTPTKIAALTLAMNIVFNTLLMFPLKIGGIALANSVSGIITFFILFALLKKRLGDFPVKEIIASFLRILAASLWMGVVCYLAWQRSSATLNKFLSLSFALICSAASYIVFCFIFRVSEMRQLWRWVAEKQIHKER